MSQQDTNEFPLPDGSDKNNKRITARHLPNFFRTNSNKKFLGGTMDVLTQPGTLTRISSYVGRRDIRNYNFDDNYLQETSTPRQYYQLEPAYVNEDKITGEVNWFGDYIDYVNALKYFGANVSNHSKLNKQEAYSWEPHIDWDKFTNYREYYWLSNGPDPITIYGELEKIESEFTVTSQDAGDNITYLFTPDGLTANPRITLYRGVKYTFNINTKGMKFAIKTEPFSGDSFYYNLGVSARNVEKGVLTFEVPYEAPDLLYYVDNNPKENLGVLDEIIGMIDIRDIKEASSLDIEKEILGKRNFTSTTGIKFINGLKLKFEGKVIPEKYAEGNWYVEGVGTRIKLVKTTDLEAPATFIKSFDVPFDDQPFDSLPWDNADNYPLTKDYIVVNRASRDRNNWARTNRWFHKTVIETSAEANKVIPEFNQNYRANRPIIEFEPDLKLYNHGYISKADVDLVDTTTEDVFSIIEGSTGYVVDGEQILPGYRILFTADRDILVKGRIFEVKQILNVNYNANENITVISTESDGNIITVPNTTDLRVGTAVRFTGTVVGGLDSAITYYIISENFSATTFSVSLTPTGSAVVLTDSAVLTMRVSAVTPGVTRRKLQLTLQEINDTQPVEGEICYITKGKTYKGSSFYYENGEWKLAQKKTKINQSPLYDLFDENLISYSNTTEYPFTTFSGNKIFGYKIGTGAVDTELGFPLVYRSIDNVGDIEFEFNLQKGTWNYIKNNELVTLDTSRVYLRKWSLEGNFVYSNGWIETDRKTEQNVVRILEVTSPTSLVPVDVYDDTSALYAIEQASQILNGNHFYIAIQDNTDKDVLDFNYWYPYDYNTQYRQTWNIDTSYAQRDIVRYNNFSYIALEDFKGKNINDENNWKLLFKGYTNKGEFNRLTDYYVDDIVQYEGTSYISIKNSSEIFPTNINYWKKLAKGSNRFRGEHNRPQTIFKQEWRTNTKYDLYDVVSYKVNNIVYYYVSLLDNYNEPPVTSEGNSNSSIWQVITTINPDDPYNANAEIITDITYNAGDIISYGIYLYISKNNNNIGNSPTNPQFWTQLSSGSIFPQYHNNNDLYQTGDIVLIDTRPKIDYRLRVYVNDKKRTDLTLDIIEGKAYINFGSDLSVGDKVVYKIRSISNKNVKGYYEIPLNWQNNPLNDTVDNFTFGEVVDHVKTIVENSGEFLGEYPGVNNLANLGQVSQYGRMFMQHSGPMSVSSFFMIDKTFNMIKSLKWAAREYTQFKKDIIQRSQTLGLDGSPRDIADDILYSYSQTKFQGKAPFYFSDMVPYGAASVRTYIVEDPRFPVFVIDSIFNPKDKIRRNILIYVNEVQLLHGRDYVFDTNDAFVTINSTLSVGDQILIKDYANTNGCYVPLTPSKLGLYPLYEPMIYEDDTYREIYKESDDPITNEPIYNSSQAKVKIIQGHDGSRFVAYNDYRDDIILEIEKRIYNSVRIDYDPTIFDIYDVLSGYYRRTDFTKTEINDVLISEFLRWNSIPSLDFNSPSQIIPGEEVPRYRWIDGDSFTYNYNKAQAPNEKESLQGYWRGVYRYFFDTDRPHSHPWEMQGFTIKPLWWEELYGLAPYTSNNKIMWDAIEKGQINDPNNRQINLKFARPGLGNYLPVDELGNLISPLDSGLARNFSKINSQGRYTFGDQAPVENAWRLSSEYPFSIMMVLTVLRGSEFISKFWDRFTVKRNVSGQIYNVDTGKRLSPKDLPFANEKLDNGTTRITSGLTNFIDEYISVQKNIDYDYYKSLIRNMDVKLRYRIGGFTSKEKIKVLLDSRTPNSSGTIFLPAENYKVFYNKSAPVDTLSYSGVIIEKRTNGYSIKGYDKEKNYFEIYPPRISANDPTFNVGGISESYVTWSPEKYYVSGSLVKLESEFFRSKVNHTSSTVFLQDNIKWQKLPKLPMVGGRDAIKRSKFKDIPVRVPYGTIFEDIQSIVDFFLGYQERLKFLGFQFEDFSTDLNAPLNWLTSAKEFMFWTLQNWVAGSVITLSPAANNLKFKPAITASVDNLDADFYEYSLFKADGSPLKSDLTNIYREDNGFQIKPTTATTDGIFHIRTNLVYQEHVLLFDNLSVFGDVIYDVIPGYRQGRIKLLGFKTNGWDGSYYSPGFVFDNAIILDWEPNTDYNLGDVVRYQNFYYTALTKVYGTTVFEFTSGNWKKLDEEPKPNLTSNFDYRIEQFRDFYSLESSNFDNTQQNLARHLTGYQQRQYLENIIIDDVSQYKFYQGFIKEKGTLNSINKLFDALRASGFSSIDIKEEWAFKVGDFGASDAYTEIEFNLQEEKFTHNPQQFLLSMGETFTDEQATYNLVKEDVVKKSITYNANPFKMQELDFAQRDYGIFRYGVAGYVNPLHVEHILYDEGSLLNYNIYLLNHRDKIWIGNTPNGEWNVMAYFNTRCLITDWERLDNIINLYLNEMPVLALGDLIVVKNIFLLEGIYKVVGIYNDFIQVFTNNTSLTKTNTDSTAGILFKFEAVRYPIPEVVNISRYNDIKIRGEKLWIDRDLNNRWKVLENSDVFTEGKIVPPNFMQTENASNGYEIKISGNKRFMFVSAINSGSGKVIIYTRPNNKNEWSFLQTIQMPDDFNINSGIEKFGYSIDVSYDGKLFVISAPDISGIKSYYKGNFYTDQNYDPGDIVRYDNKLWRNKNGVQGDGSTITINSQDWQLVEDIVEVYTSGYSSGLTKQGAVFVYKFSETSRRTFERDTYVYTSPQGFQFEKEQVITSYSPIANERFGTKVKLVQSGNEYWLYVASEYAFKVGKVQVYRRKADGQWVYNIDQQYLDFTNVLGSYPSPYLPTTDSLFGYDIAAYAEIVAVSAPFTNGGAVYIFHRQNTVFELIEVIDKHTILNNIITNLKDNVTISNNDYFGYSLSMKDNRALFVSAPNNDLKNTNVGIVYKFEFSGLSSGINPFYQTQLILPPSFIKNERFGVKIDTNLEGNILAVSSAGGNVILDTTFDVYTERSVFTNDSTRNYVLDSNSPKSLVSTTFDQGATAFFDRISYTGAVYIFNEFDGNFIYADKLQSIDILESDDNFGSSLIVGEDCIVVGAPKRKINNLITGISYVFDYDTTSWAILESQSEMVDIDKFKKAFIYNTKTNKLLHELDFVDPAKGRIPGPANQEIKYQTMRDPASYTYVNASDVLIDQSEPWTDEHLGEVWWDLSTVKWIWYEQGDISYRTNYWGEVFPGSSIDVYEWTETTLLPSQWLEQSTTAEGIQNGISGIPIYLNDLTYSSKEKYDPISGYLTTYYYYWVRNKVTIPNVSWRRMSVFDVSQMILDPASTGYKFVAITNKNTFTLFNVQPDVYHTDVNLNVQFYEVDNTDLIVHREYALISENDDKANIPSIVENKWWDSLCGSNIKGQPVPDPRLSFRQRYGASNEPRQTWFSNRYEALKQYVEYANYVLKKNQIIDNINFDRLNSADPLPNLNSGEIDQIVDILDDLRFIGTAKIRSASLTPIVTEGKITSVRVDDTGYGYKVPPTIKIRGTGTGAVLRANLDNQGKITSVTVIKSGKEYDSYSTILLVRNYTVLVLSDEEALGGWSLHDWSGVKKSWVRVKTQGWNVRRYWSYADWYASGYSSESEIAFQVEMTVDLDGLNSQIGDLVKVNNVGGSWLLLRRRSINDDPNFTQTYDVVGKQNSTIQFSDLLYNLNQLGYDSNKSYDLGLYDQGPDIELRIILQAIRDDIFINDLRIEYMNLFFNSVQYALTEQLYVDWVFKSSFLKVNHNVGSLKQRITFQGDELSSYQKYIEEVKPYKSKIREFVDAYNTIDDAQEKITDFDLFSYYNRASRRIERGSFESEFINSPPWKDWLDNHKFEVTEIEIYDNGNGYVSVPKVIISGGGGTDASATAYIANGKVYKIIVDNPGFDYTSSPTVTISGGLSVAGSEIQAKAIAKIGNNKVRTNIITMRYDRITSNYYTNTFTYTDTFSGTGTQKAFKLTYAPDPRKININILVNNVEIYGDLYEVSVQQILHASYNALEGTIIFKDPPVFGTNNIVITYYKNIALFDAADRINYSYAPEAGQYGKDLGLLMTGVDYGGVQLQSIDFDIGGGWDVLSWDVTSWDNVVSTNDDYVVSSDGTTRAFILPYTPAVGEIINVYINGNRIDDPYFNQYDGSTEQLNGRVNPPDGTIMNSFVGDNNNRTIIIPETFDLLPDDYIVFRKSTSDGTILPTDRSLIDAFVDGGNLTYTSAKGITAAEIVVDGDGFVTLDTSHGPEELVQGQVVDSLNIEVYHAPSFGGPNVYVRNYTGDGITNTFELGPTPSTVAGIFVIVDGVLLTNTEDSTITEQGEFQTNFEDNTITISTPPVLDKKIAIITVDTAGFDILEKITFIGDGSTVEFLTGSRYLEDNISGFITINGISTDFTLLEDSIIIPPEEIEIGRRYRILELGTTDFTLVGAFSNEPNVEFYATSKFVEGKAGTGSLSYVVPGNTIVRFDTPPTEGAIIQIILFRGIIRKWSEVTTQYIPVESGVHEYALDPKPANLGPLSTTAFVVADNEFLQSPDYEFFVYDGSPLFITDLRYGPNILSPQDIDVYIDGEKLTPVSDYILDSTTSSITMSEGVATVGDSITVEIYKFADYRVDIKGWDGSTFQELSLIVNVKNYQLINQKMLRVTTFTNHDILRVKTSNLGFRFITGYDSLQYDVVQYDILSTATNTSGVFNLPRTVGETSGVFVALNRELLSPNSDYVVLDTRNQVKVLLPDILEGKDYIQIITFNDKTVQPSYGFKIFKDMMNRYAYKRLDSSSTTTLKKDLLITDTSIEVLDASKLPIPSKENNLPGIIEIDEERIEYFVKEFNESKQTWILSQLRRGTLGTGAKNLYPVNTEIKNIGAENTIPYSDVETKKVHYGDGSSHIFDLDFVPNVRTGQIYDGSTTYVEWYREEEESTSLINATNIIPGRRYKIVSTGTTNFTTIGASANLAGTIFWANAVGIGNGKAVELLSTSIPYTFGQCDEIEVFVGGRRLNKSPRLVYDQTLGQDSYNAAGDKLIEAEFSVDGVSPVVRITTPPQAGELVVIVRKTGRLWQKTNENSSLVFSTTDVARFLRAKQVILPK